MFQKYRKALVGIGGSFLLLVTLLLIAVNFSSSPAPANAASVFSIQFTTATATDHVSGTVSVHTLPNAALTITVTYCSGRKATSASLQGISYADKLGNKTWKWVPDTTCKGYATALVNASLNSLKATNSIKFLVH